MLAIFGSNVFQIILYGSVARNEATEDSDIDIAIILDHSIDEAVRERFIGWAADMDMKYDCVLSIVDIEKEKYAVKIRCLFTKMFLQKGWCYGR